MSLIRIPGSFKINEVIPLVKPGNGCDFHRLTTPFQALRFDKTYSPDITLRELCKDAKIVTFNREPGINIQELYDLRKEFGFKIIVDWDDYWVLHEKHALYEWWEKNGAVEKYETIIKEADAVTCTTPRLAEKVEKLNTNCYVVPNAVPFNQTIGQWIYEKEKLYGGVPQRKFVGSTIKTIHRTRFGWVGGSSHLHDIKSIAPVFKEFPYLDFSLCGYDKTGLDAFMMKHTRNLWDDMEEIVNPKAKNPNYKRVWTKSLDTYMTHYDSLDVAVVPLENLEWNSFKSSLKCYEAGVKKVACIVSNQSPYIDDVPEDVVTYCDNLEEWMDAIDDHQDLGYVKQQAERLHNWVFLNRNLHLVSAYRMSVYEHIANGGISIFFPTYEDSLTMMQDKLIQKLAA